MGRPLSGSAAGTVRTVGVAGTVAAAVVAHVGAGAAVPSPLLLVSALLGVGVLSHCADRLPAGWRTVRLRLAAAVALQPLLHMAFDLRVPPGNAMVPSGVMLLAHLGAAAGTVWWLDRGAARLVAVARTAVRAVPGARPSVVPVGTRRVLPVLPEPPAPDGRDASAGLRRRGPPAGVASLTPARS